MDPLNATADGLSNRAANREIRAVSVAHATRSAQREPDCLSDNLLAQMNVFPQQGKTAEKTDQQVLHMRYARVDFGARNTFASPTWPLI